MAISFVEKTEGNSILFKCADFLHIWRKYYNVFCLFEFFYQVPPSNKDLRQTTLKKLNYFIFCDFPSQATPLNLLLPFWAVSALVLVATVYLILVVLVFAMNHFVQSIPTVDGDIFAGQIFFAIFAAYRRPRKKNTCELCCQRSVHNAVHISQ
jgi:hypothetical protein